MDGIRSSSDRTGTEAAGYEIPTFGGEVRLIARDGLNPSIRLRRHSDRVLDWRPTVGHAVPGSGSIWTIPVMGGTPRELAAGFTAARLPIWSPDGKRLLVHRLCVTEDLGWSALDWWVSARMEAKW